MITARKLPSDRDSERPKLCQLCGSLPDRVVGPSCRKCGLEFAPDDTIPQVFGKPRLVAFIPPPEEQPKPNKGRSYKKDPVVAAGMTPLPGWRIIEVMAELVRVEHFDCCVQRVVTRRHLRNAKGGSVRLLCKQCDARAVRI